VSADFESESDALQDMLLVDSVEIGGLGGNSGEHVLSGDITTGYAVLLTNLHTMYVLKYDNDDMCLLLHHKFVDQSVLPRSIPPAMVSPTRGDDLNDGTQERAHDNSNRTTLSTIVSVSLYYGSIFTPSKKFNIEQPISTRLRPTNTYTPIEAEENYLYGSPLDSEEVSVEPPSTTILSGFGREDFRGQPDDDMTVKFAYIVTSEVNGCVKIIRLDDLVCVFSTTLFTNLEHSVSLTAEPPPPTTYSNRLIIESRLVMLTRSDGVDATLNLVLLFNTGDLAVYTANIYDSIIHSFYKSDYRTVSNIRKFLVKSKVVRRNDEPETSQSENNSSSTETDFIEATEYLKSVDYLNRTVFILNFMDDLDGQQVLLISCNSPLILFNCHGLPQLIPLGLPELPYINYGHHRAVSCQFGRFQGIATLWYEHDDIESLKHPNPLSRSMKQSTLGIYQSIPSTAQFPGASVSINKVLVGKTVHKFKDLQNRSDVKTEQVLLAKKTHLLLCSEEKKIPFPSTMMAPDEVDNEDIYLERYFPQLDSFCQPSTDAGPAPALVVREHSLVLIQGGAVVDSYKLNLNERVMDATVVYFTLQKALPNHIMIFERRVFVAACTSVADKRGEDTQGNGRLLFFGLDYGLYHEIQPVLDEESVQKSVDMDGIKVESTTFTENEGNEHIDRMIFSVNNVEDESDSMALKAASTNLLKVESSTTIASSSSSNAASNAFSMVVSEAANRDTFLKAITPKLSLLWTGPGPASVVKQLGEFLLSTVGATVFVYKIIPATLELEQVSFYFAQVLLLHLYMLSS